MPRLFILQTDADNPKIFTNAEICESWIPVTDYCVEEKCTEFVDAAYDFKNYAHIEKFDEYYKIDVQNFVNNIENKLKQYKEKLQELTKVGFDSASNICNLYNFVSSWAVPCIIYKHKIYYTFSSWCCELKLEFEQLLKEKKDLYLTQAFTFNR